MSGQGFRFEDVRSSHKRPPTCRRVGRGRCHPSIVLLSSRSSARVVESLSVKAPSLRSPHSSALSPCIRTYDVARPSRSRARRPHKSPAPNLEPERQPSPELCLRLPRLMSMVAFRRPSTAAFRGSRGLSMAAYRGPSRASCQGPVLKANLVGDFGGRQVGRQVSKALTPQDTTQELSTLAWDAPTLSLLQNTCNK